MPATNTAKGTRDFSKNDLVKRNYIFNIIKETYELFGFEPLETPAMENIETLTGKYTLQEICGLKSFKRSAVYEIFNHYLSWQFLVIALFFHF